MMRLRVANEKQKTKKKYTQDTTHKDNQQPTSNHIYIQKRTPNKSGSFFFLGQYFLIGVYLMMMMMMME